MSHFYLDIHEARIREAYARIARSILIEEIPIEAKVAVTDEPVPYEQRLKLKYKPIRKGELWGRDFACGWFHVTGRVPESWKGSYVVLHLGFGGESLLFDADGNPLCGLTNGSVFMHNYHKDLFHWLRRAKGGETIDFWADAGANSLFGLDIPADPDQSPKERPHGTWDSRVDYLSVARFDEDAWQLWLDLEVLIDLFGHLPEKSSRRIRLVRATSRALDLLPPERGGAKAVRKALRETAFAVPADPGSIHVTAIGHAHIDTAWLWPFRETVRKAGRTFSSQIGLIERYPMYKFGASQAQLYAFVKERYPKLYAKIKKAIAKKQWEVQGGMWVEADCNLPSGESLIRQFLCGERFFDREFGVRPRNLWLPDVFGYSGNLPQILRVCGIEFFLTQKLSWNRYNKFPHNSFVWEGIDGSRVVSHFPPEDTYNADVLPHQLMRHESNNGEAGIVDEAISLFGLGDGGGGPKEEHIERGLRCRDLNGCPRFSFGFAQDAMDRIAQQAEDLDTWVGELYFEMHRGTLTTQARQKKANRRAEEALRAAEMLCAAAYADKPKDYPAAAFDRLWETVCLCQFHDVIPGSSIARVYREAGAMVEAAIAEANALAEKAGRRLLAKAKDTLALFNPSSTDFEGVVALPEGAVAAACGGEPLPCQTEGDKTVAWVRVPAKGFATLALSRKGDTPAVKVAEPPAGNRIVLENDLVRYELDGALRVVRAFDKECGREFIRPEAPGNDLRLFDDHPSSFDAWDFEEYAKDMCVATPAVTSLQVVAGPVRSGVYAAFTLGKSLFHQTVWLAFGSKRLDFETSVEWAEKHKLCRVYFPVDVQADEARFEIQYGTVARATHDNTKWQYAQFEGVAHRYADLSDPDFGVALLNDCKYGYRVKGSVLSLSLLRAPTNPDPFADLGTHRFTYAVFPHAGTLAQGDSVVREAAALNQGVVRFEGYARRDAAPALPIDFAGEGVELAVLKKAEDSDDLVVRLVERRGRRTEGRLLVPGKRAGTATEILATELGDLGKPRALSAKLAFRPFEIKTLRIRFH